MVTMLNNGNDGGQFEKTCKDTNSQELELKKEKITVHMKVHS